MKNLKSNNRILSYLICFSLLAFVNIGCNENDDLEILEESETNKKEALTKAMAKGGNIKRTRIKQRSNGLYRASIIVNNDNKNQVSAIALEIEAKKGVLNETKTYYLEYYTTIKNEKYYTFSDIKFDGKELDNQDVVTNIALLDINKKPIGAPRKGSVLLGGIDAKVKRVRIRVDRTGGYKITTKIDNNDDNDAAEVKISVNDLQGNTTTFNANPNKNNTINTNFSFEKESTSDKMLVAYTLKDLFGDVINTFKEEVTVESNIKIGIITLKETSNGLVSSLISIKNDNNNLVETIELVVETQKAINKEVKIILKYSGTKGGVKYYKAGGTYLFENVNEVPKKIAVGITLLSKEKEKIKVFNKKFAKFGQYRAQNDE